MRKIFAFVFLLAILISIISCGKGGSQEINVIVWDDAHTKAVASQIEAFEKATGIKVNFDQVSTKNIVEKIAVTVNKKSAEYDLVALDEPYVAMFADLMIPYEQWPEGAVYQKVGLDEVMPAAFEAGKWDGHNKGLPINGNLYVWMTRKDILENPDYQNKYQAMTGNKLAMPDTFDDLISISKFLDQEGVHGFAPFTKKMEGATCEAVFMFRSYGTSVLEHKNGKYNVILDREKAINAIKMYKELLKYSPKGAANFGHSERLAAFRQKKVFSMFIWPSQIPQFEAEESQLKGQILYSAPPAGPVTRAPVRGAWILAIPEAAKNKAAAAEFAYWWCSYDSGKELVKAGMSPVREDLLTDPDLAMDRPWYKGQFESLKYAVNRPRFSKYTEVSDIIQNHWMAAVTDSITPEQAVDNIIADTKSVLNKYGY